MLGLTEVPTPKDADITAVCEYMGYSTETIKNLREIKTQPFFIADEPEEYDQNGNLISKWHEEPSETLLRIPDGPYDDAENYTKAEAKQAVDKFFSAEGISEFFTELAHVQKVYTDKDPFKSVRIEQYALYDLAKVCMNIAAQAFTREGEDN